MKHITIVLPVFVGVALTYFLWRSFLSVAILSLVFLFAYVKRRSFRVSAPFIAAGLVLGLIIEITCVRWSHSTSVSNPDFFGLPLWMPVVVIYAGLLFRRVSMSLGQKTDL